MVDFVLRNRPDILFLGDMVTARHQIGRLKLRLERDLGDVWFMLPDICASPTNWHWHSNPHLSGEIHLTCGPRLSAGSKWRSMVPGGAGTNHAVATLPSGAPLHLTASWPLSAYCEQRQRIVSGLILVQYGACCSSGGSMWSPSVVDWRH